jgi:DNA-directed RNA polymerase specialized sigma24 family protein
MEADTPTERRLGHLTPRARQAFLLVSLEGFSEEDAADILGVDLENSVP